MRYVKMLGLLAVAAAALMAFAGSASATTLTSPKGTTLGVGATIHGKAEAPHTQLHGSVSLTCTGSEVKGKISNAGGASATVEGTVESLTFTGCGSDTISVIKGGSLIIHSTGGNTGTVTSNGAEVTALVHRTIFGFPITTHCIYKTANTPIGSITGSDHKVGQTTATMAIGSSPIPEVATDSSCKDDSVWTGNYEITTPDHLYID